MKIEIKSLYKSFEKEIFNNFNYIFEDKKITAIMGSSGCGKTTLINIILGFEKADSGEIVFENKPRFSVVFQEDRLLESFSAKENIILNGCKEENCDYFLKKFGLYESKDKKCSSLSGGMKRRVSLIRALTYDADIYILDEPFKGLDEETKANAMEIVKDTLKNKTCILITHDRSEAEIADNILEIEKVL